MFLKSPYHHTKDFAGCLPGLFLFLSIIVLTPFLSSASHGASTNTTAPVTDSAYKSASERSISRILILHSYNFGFLWTDNISEGINSVLEDYKDEVEIIYEFLDSRRIYSDVYFQELRDLYNLKYANRPIDIVICSDDHALNFVVKHDMFKNTPVVFCSVTGFDPAVSQKREITGLEEALSIEKTLEIALAQNPDTRHVTVVNARTLTGQSLKKKAAPIFNNYKNLSFEYLDTLTIEGLTAYVSDLPEDHIIFLFIFNQDRSGRAFSHERNLEILREHSSVPLYSVWGFYLGHGIVGGKLASGRAEGEMVAETALRILHGEKASEIPVRMSPTQYMFDYSELQYWHVKRSSLPAGSIVINRPSSFYHDHKSLIWAIAGAFLMLVIFVIVLLTNIARRKRIEEELRESEEKHRIFLENFNGIAYQAAQKSFIPHFFYGMVEEITGYDTEDFMSGKVRWDQIIYKDDLDLPLKINERLKENPGYIADYEYRIVTRNGELKWVRDIARSVPSESGDVSFVQGAVYDINERKKAAGALQESERFMKNVFEAIRDGISVLDRDLNVIKTNQWMEEMYSHHDTLTGCKCFAVFQQRSEPCPWCPALKTLKTGRTHTEIIPYPSAETPRGWIELTAFPVKNESGEVINVIEYVKDITARKIAEDSLIESEKHYQELFDSVIEGIAVIDENEIIRFVNPALVNIFGENSENAMLGKNFFDHFPEDQKKLIAKLSEKSKAGKTSQYESEILTADGKTKHLFVSITPRFDANRKFSGAFCTVLDITDNKRLRELESRAERLETAATIAGQVAHDFNNLLAPLMAYPEFIRDELPGGNPALEFIDDIENAAKKISEINQDLLTMGRRVHYNQQVIDLNKIVLQAARDMESTQDGFRIETDLEENLMKIKGGASQIHRALTNLLTNARDAMHKKDKALIKTENYYSDDSMIALSKVPKGEYVKLTISDSGTGIHPDIIEKIFDPFFSTKTADRKRGTGLGLSVVEAVVKDHRGHIDINSKVGDGTSFFIYFPITREESPQPIPEELGGGNESILIIDDDEVQRNVTSRLLKNLGYDIYTVESGERAIEFLKEKQFDLLILDMVMPDGIDGTETYRQILKINPNQKAIIVSGFSMSDRVREAQRLGAGEFVPKPITRKKIALAVRNELDSRVRTSSS
jgi:PAS domain S-box-containing protein